MKILSHFCLATVLLLQWNSFAHAQTGIEIFVQFQNHPLVTIGVEASDSIENVKTKIEDKLGLVTSRQGLFFNDHLLQDDRSIGDYSIQAESTLLLYVYHAPQSVVGPQTWDGDSEQLFQISDFGLNGFSHTQYEMDDTLDLSGTSLAHPLTLRLVSNNSATLQNFDPLQSYTWLLADTNGIIGFNPDAIRYDTTGFLPHDGGVFRLFQDGNQLQIDYAPIPEPSTWAMLLCGVGALAFCVRRKTV